MKIAEYYRDTYKFNKETKRVETTSEALQMHKMLDSENARYYTIDLIQSRGDKDHSPNFFPLATELKDFPSYEEAFAILDKLKEEK